MYRDLLYLGELAAPEEGRAIGEKLLRLGLEVEKLNGTLMGDALDYNRRFRRRALRNSCAIARRG